MLYRYVHVIMCTKKTCCNMFPLHTRWLQIVRVMEDRARSMDLMKHKYYDLLYCYHTTKQNYRKGVPFCDVVCAVVHPLGSIRFNGFSLHYQCHVIYEELFTTP